LVNTAGAAMSVRTAKGLSAMGVIIAQVVCDLNMWRGNPTWEAQRKTLA